MMVNLTDRPKVLAAALAAMTLAIGACTPTTAPGADPATLPTATARVDDDARDDDGAVGDDTDDGLTDDDGPTDDDGLTDDDGPTDDDDLTDDGVSDGQTDASA